MTLNKPVPLLDAQARVAGTVPYAANLHFPDMLVARVLRSYVPHGRITHLDASAAEQMPGVAAVLTGADLGRAGGPRQITGLFKKDQPLLAYDHVRYVGEPVAIVAAETEAIAEAALMAIDVRYEEQPAVYDAYQALQPGAPLVHESLGSNRLLWAKLRRGDVEAGFAAADEIVEETYFSPSAQHVSLEPHVSAAQWQDGRLTVWTAAQAPYQVRMALAELFDIDTGNVRVIVPPLGGGYGGKAFVRIEPLVAALAWKAGQRPVKLALKRDEEFVTVTKHAARLEIKSGVKRDGTITARQVTIYWNGGAYADGSPLLVRAGMVRSIGPYRIENVWIDSYGVYTNLPPAGAFRGAMSSQGTWAYESHTDTIAHRLGLDPLAYRLQHLLQDGDTFATGETMYDVHFVECLRACADRLQEGEREPTPAGSARRRGRGVAVMMKNTIPTTRSECRLELASDGRLTLHTSTVEMGQGAHTALAQIAASGAGMPVEAVSVAGPDTERSPYDTTTSASRATTMMGTAVLAAAADLKEQLLGAAAPLLEHRPEELDVAEGLVFVAAQPGQRISCSEVLGRHGLQSLTADGSYETEGGLDPETGQGVSTPHWHQGAGACEVEVDTQTGKVRVLRYYGASYAGQVVNPELARLQNDGNIIFGLGPAMMEEIVADGGQIINSNLSDYMIPSFLDVPPELHTVSLETEGAEFHGIGEMTLPSVAPAIANAIYDALGVRIYALPLTPERVLRAIRDRKDAS